jgi:hypothetical protein
MCVEEPAPEEAKESFPGERFASATSSATLRSGESAATMSTLVIEATNTT